MKKLVITLALAFAYLTANTVASAYPPPPTCDPNCPWIR